MKIQCSCGAKYVIDVTPGMQPIKFVCQNCGQDYSAFVNELIRKETGEQTAAPTPAPEAAPPPAVPAVAASAPPPPTSSEGPKLRISRPHAAETPAVAQPAEAPVSKYCPRHRTELATDNCQVCKKPICPKCMETFGPFCSPFCRNKVEGVSMEASVHIGGRFTAQRQFWRKVSLIATPIGVALALVFGFWFWYAWIGSAPKVYFSVRWDDISHSGTSHIVDGNQLIFLHGGTLARYNLQTKQKVWSLDLVSSQQVADALKEEDQQNEEEFRHSGSNPDPRPGAIREKEARIGLEQQLSLYDDGKNVWVARDNVLTHYDWETGNVLGQVTLTNGFGFGHDFTLHGDELLAAGAAPDGSQSVTHISLNDGSIRTEEFSGTPAVAAAPTSGRAAGAGEPQGGIPLTPDQAGRPMNPARVADQAQNMSLPGRIALPALIANSQHNEQINQELRDENMQENGWRGGGHMSRRRAAPQQPVPGQSASPDSDDEGSNMGDISLVPDGDSYIAFGSQMIKENMVERDAMRAPPKHSALDDPNLGTANEQDAINQQLNEMQRNNGGGTVTEDQSTYQVVLRRPGSAQPDWTGQVIGPPEFYPLNTVNVLAAGKTLTVFDKTNKRLWQANLTYPVTGGGGGAAHAFSEQSEFGAGPCVENNGTLYVFDQAVLSAFDPSSGNAKWRIPSVGMVGLFFDDKGMVYANTTSGNPDDIKYSRDIDVSKGSQAIVMKVDPASGKILWTYNPGGYISYLSGKFIYSWRSFDPGDSDEDTGLTGAVLQPAYLKIIRINPGNGHVMWEHDEGRAPVDLQFDGNMISIVLKKEVEVLRFFSL